MSADNIWGFLRMLAAKPDVLESLRFHGVDEVIAAAAELGYPFSKDEYDPLVWGKEEELAAKRGEEFGFGFALWQTMWGTTYLDYLVADLVPALEEAGLL
jgi:hypothetical protein